MEIKGIDCVSGLARFRNNADRFMKVLQKFALGSEMPDMSFDEAVSPENTADTKARIHTLKGVAGNLAINELFRLCGEFEKTLVAGAPDRALYESICKEYDDVKRAISAKVDSGVSEQSTVRSDRDECVRLLTELKLNAERYDAAACEAIVEKLRASKWTDVDKTLLQSAISFIDSYDFEDAIMVIDSLIF